MNKSKFLKKSLAAILSVLLIVAMIPLSAAAATASVSRISIGDVDGTGSGREWTVKDIAQGSVVIKVTLANDTGKISVVDRSEVDGAGSVTSVGGTNTGVWEFTATDAEVAAGKATFDLVDSNDNTTRETYTVTFNFKQGSADVSLKDVLVDTQYGPTVVDGDTYTITLPYGTASATLKVYPNNASAVVTGGSKVGNYYTVSAGAISDGKSTTKVEVKNGSTSHIYTVKTVNASAFASFSVAGQRKDAKIEPDHATNPTVTVYMPFGSNAKGSPASFKVTPTFTPGHEFVDIKAKKTGGSFVAFESGKEIDLKDYDGFSLTNGTAISGTLTLQVTYSDVGATPEEWHVVFNVPAKDPSPTLKTLSLGTFKATIDETTHTATLNVPKSMRDDTTAELKATASEDTKIHLTDVAGVTEQTITTTDDPQLINADSATPTPARKNFPISTKNEFIIRVTSAGDEDGNAADGTTYFGKVQDYKLVINTVDIVGKAEITEMKLEKNDTAKTQYTATIKDNVITFTLPYATSNDPDHSDTDKGIDGWKLYYSLSNGATISNITLPSGLELDGKETYFPATFENKTAEAASTKLIVDNTESTTEYKIVVKLEKPRNVASMTGVKLTNAEDSTNSSNFGYDDMKDNENTFAATGSKDLVVTIPYSKYGDFTGAADKAILTGTLAGGAKVYYVDSSDQLNAMGVLTETNKSVAKTDSNLPDAVDSGNEFDGVHKDGNDKLKTLKIVVVSEKGATNAAGADKITSGTTTLTGLAASDPGTYTTYTLIIKQADPQKLHALDSISIFDNVTKTKIDANIQVNDHKITFTLPASFVKDLASGNGLTGAIKRDLYLDIATSHYETVKAYQDEAATAIANNQILNMTKIVYNSDGSYKSGGAQLAGAVNAATPRIYLTSSGDSNPYQAGLIRVESEEYVALNGANGTGGYQNYDVVVKYEDVKKGDTLNSVTINGVTASPDANKKVTINLPKGTDLTGLRPTFNVSPGAFVSKDSSFTANTSLIQSGDLLNFTQRKTIWVMSENGANKTQYTLEVKNATGFNDVRESDWFYSYVMQASEMGIVIGSTDGNFYPNNPVTRAQFATMIARTQSDFQKDGTYTNPFSDMNGVTGETLNAVSYCAEKKFITGSGDTTFRPDDNITRQEMAVIIARVRDLDVENVNIGSRFADDSTIDSWAKNYVYACVNANMLLGAGNNTYNPKGVTDRASAATVAIRVKNANAK